MPLIAIDGVSTPLDGIRLPVAGMNQLTTLDYPDHLACVVFLQGCPLRCGYCDNSQRMTPRRGDESEWQAVREFLEHRRGLLEAVVFSGGEPTLHNALPIAIREVKAMGFKVGLHTAGPYPARLTRLLPHLDWVGLDVKGRGRDFDRICGRPGIWQRNSQSLMALLESGIDFECRTTVHWRDFDLADVERLALTLADCGVRRYAIQVARTRDCLDPTYCQPVAGAPPRAMLAGLVKRLAPNFERIELRE
ncbi:anaerobic ribonucleoside-triphosphate reductase activating protein [Halomonas sp. MCCC 1A17488]|jgi:pyruvate formate lyase activating enzyme|uniref:Anaerobic ribonucleoside-triphosphate reductase activating protein n=1 Tax=Billgrantia sulfidoxydans TaxID=2733484 RepID=A0ABX7W0Z6_9GAMM|nr:MULTISPECIES: anaerobic ribonucleoside-triphosphate reductase activating protein [Halomonas]MCE8017052.1 anaerobic ribonucleoside-triphosphate reductase activating protein [Halomonas sp. MCCC 1A17488]MCE8035027.1 anaerobic ribonucleoside-triphosphate reductase activating protein [Halomonas sp. MCCC 1A11057]MCG3240385.1 anaerobic ribonucleoside-triphosphate reductase activating protein [Halomonas sp. MCCC 1A17488]QPP49751.1 anaerobic ribonucleoside-triphosphate reductase activating protein [H